MMDRFFYNFKFSLFINLRDYLFDFKYFINLFDCSYRYRFFHFNLYNFSSNNLMIYYSLYLSLLDLQIWFRYFYHILSHYLNILHFLYIYSLNFWCGNIACYLLNNFSGNSICFFWDLFCYNEIILRIWVRDLCLVWYSLLYIYSKMTIIWSNYCLLLPQWNSNSLNLWNKDRFINKNLNFAYCWWHNKHSHDVFDTNSIKLLTF